MGADISVNRKALHEYFILDRFEAGIELKGTEVKSIRAGHVNLSNAFARIEKGQAWLYDVDIQPYAKASHEQHEATRMSVTPDPVPVTSTVVSRAATAAAASTHVVDRDAIGPPREEGPGGPPRGEPPERRCYLGAA